MSKDAEEMLTQWGLWVWENSVSLGYRSNIEILMRDNVQQTGRRSSSITDEEAGVIDRIICDLWHRSEKVADCLRMEYATSLTQTQIGYRLGLKRLKVREYVLKGVAYVEGRLDEKQAA
jgi:hypothetical protein